MINKLISLFSPRYPAVLVYMLQNCEYQAGPYLAWYWRTQNFSLVIKRKKLQRTRVAKLLLMSLYIGIGLQLAAAIYLIAIGLHNNSSLQWQMGIWLALIYPLLWSHLIIVPLVLGRLIIIEPRQRAQVSRSEKIFAEHPGIKIAITGSYGKTSMKEILLTVLETGKQVRATPANLNVAVSHARFAKTLTGQEEILLIEYGEGKPGDVAQFTKNTHPSHAVITGVAPAHLNHYPTLQAAGSDIFSVADELDPTKVFVNIDSEGAKPFIQKEFKTYSRNGALGWKVEKIQTSLEGTSFILKKAKQSLKLHSKLIGEHHIGPLSLAAALALEIGLTQDQVKTGIAKTKPFEHRMEPRQQHGAWIIDDTYNGNIDGIAAGLELLKKLPAKRKIYVTPGLVEQGVETATVHRRLGALISAAQPQITVLMKNSVTSYIEEGLWQTGYKGELRIETDPLAFYTGLEHFIAAGDLVLMQNDWTDNYN